MIRIIFAFTMKYSIVLTLFKLAIWQLNRDFELVLYEMGQDERGISTTFLKYLSKYHALYFLEFVLVGKLAKYSQT